MLRLKFKYKILLVIFFLVLITSLWPKNIYLLVLFSFLTYVILPTKKWWDPTAIVLFIILFDDDSYDKPVRQWLRFAFNVDGTCGILSVRSLANALFS